MNSIAITFTPSLIDRMFNAILGCFGGAPSVTVPEPPPPAPPIPEKTAIEIGDSKEKTAKKKKPRLTLRSGILGALSLPGTNADTGTETK